MRRLAFIRSREIFFAISPKSIAPKSPTLPPLAADIVQLDEVALAMLCDPAVRAKVTADGNDPRELAELYVEAIAEAVAGAPADLAIGVHLCRGNFKGRYLAEGGYDQIAEALFKCAGITHFLLEFDTARAGDFKPLSLVAHDKGVVLGLVSSKNRGAGKC